MNILYISPYVPSRIRVRPYNFISGLSKLGHRIDVFSQMTHSRERKDVEELSSIPNVKVQGLPLSSTKPFINCTFGLVRGEPLWVAYGRDVAFLRKIREQIDHTHYDIVHVEHIRSLHLLPFLRSLSQKSTRPALIFDAVDCITHLFSQYANRPGSLLRKILYRLETAKMKKFEPLALSVFDATIITSQREKDYLSALEPETAGKIYALGNGVDLEYYTPQSNQTEPNTLIFFGRMSFQNNREAALFLAKEILPRLQKIAPKTHLLLVGADPPKEIYSLARQKNIEVLGYVEDIRPFLNRASVAVCPLLTGVGMQNKLLEAMAMAKPTVTTPLAAQSLKVEAGNELFIAENPDEFTAVIFKLLKDPQLAYRSGLKGRAYVERHHCWDDRIKEIEEIYSTSVSTVSSSVAEV